ncbi:cilia- and flagella-associated protein 161 isoform X2 [Electrophorus electricus]|uniref:cilia- and flagella-associated protein 161 isoform X2 n=1 Tax=Electrophorus electricus TaxID=8005 RepID=UPI0015D08F9D|nr:cilia- and flagella-associated protein 161 isoform X2 [Electrophorus electricus]
MANVRTYNRNVRVGNWREDATLEEESLKDFLHRKEKGQLTVQKTGMLRQNILKPGPCQVGGASSLKPCVRNAFVITSVDGTSNGTVLRYEESFALRTTAGFAGGLYLASDLRTFEKCAKLSRQQEVSLVEQHGFFCWWRVVYFDPQERLEHEGYPVQGNTKVLISHCKTNQCLAALANHVLWTPFGKEYEVTAHTFLDSHKAEQKSNHWMFITADPNEQEQSILQRQHVSPITHEHQPNPKTVIDTQGEKEN